MQTARPPTIPASVNSDSSYSRTLQVSSLQVDGSVTGSMTVPTLTVQDDVSFFGSSLTGQQTVYPTIGSVLQALQRLGLAAPGYNQETGPLLGTEPLSQQGIAVALSTDGNTLAIGGENYFNPNVGAVWIFIKTQGVWIQQGSKLIGTGAVGNSNQGFAVALSADGNTLASAGYLDDSGIGAVWIFTRTDGVWSQQGSKLVGIDGLYQGYSVSLSADGNTLAFGAFPGIGGVYIFTRTDGVWSQQGSKLVGTGYVGVSNQGWSVSLSADGNTLASGGPPDDNYVGATWVFVRTDGVWSQQGPKLVGTGYEGEYCSQGYSVCLRGNTLVVGGFEDNEIVGATWVFSRSGTTWSQVGEKLIGTGYVDPWMNQGTSVSLSDDEQTLITAGPSDNNSIGAVWVFRLVDGVWTQYNEKLVPTGYTIGGDPGYPAFGFEINAIAISGDATTIAIGAPFNNSNVGGTWVYVGAGL